mmetsp:Transcript_49422/g.82254  ORF Transcript_49422/g.82254 Transcript_49422/m.82254 type:complete len:277 (-) Transcript_49422:51-881(-)
MHATRPQRQARQQTRSYVDVAVDPLPKLELVVGFPAPRGSVDGEHLKAVYWNPTRKQNGEWTLDVQWHGAVHGDSFYDETIDNLLSMGIDRLFYWINDRYQLERRPFQQWWRSVCTPSSKNLSPNDIVFDKENNIFVQIEDVIPGSKCLVYPGYENLTVASGRQVSYASASFVNNKIVYIAQNLDIDIFSTREEYLNFYVWYISKDAFDNILLKCAGRKSRRAKKPRPFKYVGNLSGNVFGDYVKDILDANQVDHSQKGSLVKWNMDNGKACVCIL